MQGVKHHLMDFLEPTDTYSVSQFEKAAVETVNPHSSTFALNVGWADWVGREGP